MSSGCGEAASRGLRWGGLAEPKRGRLSETAGTGLAFGVREHLATIFRHWGKIVLVLVGALTVAGAISFLSSRVYVAEARVLLLDRDPVQVVSGLRWGDGGVAASRQEEVLTQVQIVESPILAERVAERLGPERVLAEMEWRWDWLRQWPGQFRARIIAGLASWSPARTLLDQLGLLPAGPPEPPPLLAAARDRIGAHVFAEAIPKTNLFVVAFEAPDGEFAALVVNELIDVYVEHLSLLPSPVRTAQLATEEAERLERELRTAEQRLQAFSAERNIISIDTQGNLLLTRLSAAEQELANLDRQLIEANERIASIRSQIETQPSEAQLSVVTRRNPVADRLLERIAELESRARQFIPGSPAADQIRGEIENLRGQLRTLATWVSDSQSVGASSSHQELQRTLGLQLAEAEALGVGGETLRSQIESLRAELRRLDREQVVFRELRREVEAKEQALRYALQRREETTISERLTGARLSNVVPVEPATVPDRPSRPRRMLNLILGAGVGLLGGIGLAYAIEFLRRSVSTPEEAEAAFGLRALAAIPRTGRRGRETAASIVEYRRLAGAVQRLRDQRGSATVFLASARPGEGRTYIAERLAAALHREGIRVLVVHVAQEEGGSKARWRVERAPPGGVPTVQDAAGEPVAVAGAGDGGQHNAVTYHALHAETHDQLGTILERLNNGDHEIYDIVIIDPPSLDRCPEQLHVAARADSVLFVIQAEHTPAVVARRSLQLLKEVEAPVFGLVLNKREYRIPSWAYLWLLSPMRA